MTVPTEGFTSDEAVDIYPIDVRIVGPKGGGELAPDFGSCQNVTVQLASFGLPTQILQRRPFREQAWIRNMDPANSVMFAERQDKLQQGNPIGFIIAPGNEEKVESQQPYWAIALPSTASVYASPAVPASTVAVQNVNSGVAQVVVTGGVVTVVTVNGVVVGSGDGTYYVPAYGSIAVTYSVAPAWAWTSIAAASGPVVVSVRDEAWADRGGKADANGYTDHNH